MANKLNDRGIYIYAYVNNCHVRQDCNLSTSNTTEIYFFSDFLNEQKTPLCMAGLHLVISGYR